MKYAALKEENATLRETVSEQARWIQIWRIEAQKRGASLLDVIMQHGEGT